MISTKFEVLICIRFKLLRDHHKFAQLNPIPAYNCKLSFGNSAMRQALAEFISTDQHALSSFSGITTSTIYILAACAFVTRDQQLSYFKAAVSSGQTSHSQIQHNSHLHFSSAGCRSRPPFERTYRSSSDSVEPCSQLCHDKTSLRIPLMHPDLQTFDKCLICMPLIEPCISLRPVRVVG